MMESALGEYIRDLWEAARPFRQKSILLRLLLFRRLCDRWEEERRGRSGVAAPGGQGPMRPLGDGITVAAEHSWSGLRRSEVNVGEAIATAFHLMEEANPELSGILRGLDLKDQEAFPDPALRGLLLRVDQRSLPPQDEEAFDRVCGELVQAAAAERLPPSAGGWSPPWLSRLLVRILKPQEGMSIYDGACGSGALLLECPRYLKALSRNHESLRLYGQEIDPELSALCRIALWCRGIRARIETGDTLRSPAYLTGDGRALLTFDRVVSHLPADIPEWGLDAWSPSDRYGRSEYGLPSRTGGQFAFLEHCLSSVNARGMLVVASGPEVLVRGREEGAIRRRMLQDDLVEAVVELGPGPASGWPCLLVMNRSKPRERRGRVLVVNAGPPAHDGEAGLADEAVDRISEAFQSWNEQKGFCRVVSSEELERHGGTLAAAPYLAPASKPSRSAAAAEWRILQDLISERDEAERALEEQIRRLGPEADER